jgi:hypothetical protein
LGLTSNARSSVARFRTTAQAIRKARRSQKAMASAKMAKTAPNNAWLRSVEVISEYRV